MYCLCSVFSLWTVIYVSDNIGAYTVWLVALRLVPEDPDMVVLVHTMYGLMGFGLLCASKICVAAQ